MFMANGEVQAGTISNCPYKGFMGPLTWEMVEGQYLTITVSSLEQTTVWGVDDSFSGMELTINVENGGKLIVEDVSCPFVINNHGTKVVRISNERIQQDGGRYKLTAPDDINARDLNVLVMAIRADAMELTQGNQVTLTYYEASADGKRPAYSDVLDLTEYFDIDTDAGYWFTSTGYNDGLFSLKGSQVTWLSGGVTGDGRDFQLNQGISYDRWTQGSAAVGGPLTAEKLKVMQRLGTQPDFNGTVSLPVETAQPGDTIAAMLENFTDYDRADVRWQWQRNPLGVWEDIPGATEMTYTVTDEDQDCHLRLCYNVGVGTDVHGMFTNEVACGKTYAGEVSLTVSSNAIELDEEVVLTFTARNVDGTPGEGFVQLKLDGHDRGESVAVEAGKAQFTLSGEDMGVGNHAVYAVFQSEDLMPEVTGEQAIAVNKIDLSGLLITNVPENTSAYYRGGKKAQWHYITVTYDPGNWPEGFALSQSMCQMHILHRTFFPWSRRWLLPLLHCLSAYRYATSNERLCTSAEVR